MDNIIVIVVAAVVGLAIGFAIAKMMEKGKASRTIANAKKEAAGAVAITGGFGKVGLARSI